jgi:hypothetical protein
VLRVFLQGLTSMTTNLNQQWPYRWTFCRKLMLSLKFRPHRATRTPHHQHRKTVIHGTRINSTAQQKGQNYTKLAKKFKSASRPWKTRACAPYLRTSGAYARLWGEKPARLPNGAFMKLVGLPTTNGSAPKSI